MAKNSHKCIEHCADCVEKKPAVRVTGIFVIIIIISIRAKCTNTESQAATPFERPLSPSLASNGRRVEQKAQRNDTVQNEL